VQSNDAPLTWRKSKACANNACIEIAEVPQSFFVRDSKNPIGSVLTFDRAAWGTFIAGVRSDALAHR